MKDHLIALSISDVATADGRIFTYNLRHDGQLVATNEALSIVESKHVRDMAETYEALLANSPQPSMARLATAQAQTIGTRLFSLWLEPHWSALVPKPGDRQIVVIASGISEVLNLPWELLRPPAREDVGTDTGWGVRRLPWADRQVAEGPALPAGPLRVLFVSCSPRDLPELDYEREEELLLRAVGPKALIETSSLGTFDELSSRVDSFQPHIVHLSGHGTVGSEGAAFYFENEHGSQDPRSAQTVGELFAGSGVRCAFISGCEAGSAPPRNALGGICQAIVAHGVPMAIGWGASIVDDIATTIAERFYTLVASGRPVDYALARARWEGKQVGPRGDLSWSLPVLYANSVDTRLLDKDLPQAGKPRPSKEQQQLPGMAQGYAQHLVGRRRELQAILPGLRKGTVRGVLMTGMGGSGKSSLATRLARELEAGAASLVPIVVSCKPNTPLKASDLLKACSVALLQSGQPEASRRTKDTETSIEERLTLLVSDISDGFVLVIDNFENTLDEATRYIQDPEIAAFYVNVLNNLIGTSRVIVTSRYLPADVDPLPDTIAELGLGELSETAYLKFMFRESKVKQRYQSVASKHELLFHLKHRLGGAPGLVKRIRQELTGIDPVQLQADIEQCVGLIGSPQGPLGLLDMKHDAYCSEIYLDRIYGRLTEASKRILGRLSVYAGPMRAADAAAISNTSGDELGGALASLRRSALIHGNWMSPDTTLSIYGTLRRWLAASPRLSADDRLNAHRATADYLVKRYDQQPKGGLQPVSLTLLLEARTHYLAAGEATEARKITYQICQILVRRGDFAEIERLNLELLAGAVPRGADASGPEQHPDPATWIARAYLERTEYQKARQWYERALTLAHDRHPVERAHAIQGLATIALREGKNTAAREQFESALEIQLSADDRHGQGITWHQLGSIDFSEGEYDAALSKFDKALKLLNGLAAEEEQATWHQLGSIELEQGKLKEARNALGKALVMAREIGNRQAEAAAHHQLGRVDAADGTFADALGKLRRALEIRRAVGDRAGEALSFRRLGNLASQLGRHELALRLAIVCLVIRKAIEVDTKRDLEDVQGQAASLRYPPEKLSTILAEVEADYLGHRARMLLTQAYALA